VPFQLQAVQLAKPADTSTIKHLYIVLRIFNIWNPRSSRIPAAVPTALNNALDNRTPSQ